MITKTEWGETLSFRIKTKGLNGDMEEEQEFENIYGPTRNPDLSSLEYEITALEVSNDSGSFHRKRMTEMMDLYGGDDWKTPILIIKLKIEDEFLQQEFLIDMIKYGSNWKMKGYTEWR